MTPESQRIAIAEACGWKKVREHWENNVESAYCNDSHCHRQLPNYLSDLNAMHEAEKVLTDEQWEQYVRLLSRGITRTWWESSREVCYATAAHRAEDFLRTLNL